MPKLKALRVAKGDRLSLANIDARAVDIDWNDERRHDRDGFEIVLPDPTYGDWAEYEAAPDAVQALARRHPGRRLSEKLRQQFEQTEEYDEWRDGFEPMMNYVWPVMLPYGADAREVAAKIAAYAPATTLVEFGDGSAFCPEEYGIALTGGGMDLSDQLAAAYLCAGAVPPVSILHGLRNTINDASGHGMRARIGPALRDAYRQAVEFQRNRARRLEDEARAVFGKPSH